MRYSRQVRALFLCIIILLMASNAVTHGAESAKRADAAESVKKRLARERQFLYRAVEELNKSQEYVQDTVRILEKQIEAVEFLEPSQRERDLGVYLEWYRSYGDWLRGNTDAFEADLSRAYSGEPVSGFPSDRCDAMTDGYMRLGSQLEEHVAHLEKINNKNAERIEGLRTALTYIDSAAYREEKNKDKKQRQSGGDRRDDDLYTRYKDITDAELAQMRLEFKTLDDLQKHFAVLLELGRLELSWLTLKTDDSAALSDLARVVGKEASAPVEDASNRMIKKYESDIVQLKRKADDLSRLRSGLVRTGTLRTLDRIEELSEYYERMRARYEHHITWLTEQIGGYRADLIELRKEKEARTP